MSSNSSLNSMRSSSETNSGNLINGSGNGLNNQQQHMNTQQMIRLDSFDQVPDQTSMMAKVNLFKSRTLLNDHSKCVVLVDGIKIMCG